MYLPERNQLDSYSLVNDNSSSTTLLDVLRKAANEHADKGVFLCASEKNVSYRALWQDGKALASGLVAKGILRGTPLIVTTDDTRSFLAALWGGILAGNTVAPIPHLIRGKGESSTQQRLRGIWKTLSAFRGRSPLLLCGSAEQQRLLRETLPDLPAPLQISCLLEHGLLDEPDLAATPDDVAIIQFSSGSTGQPKGVLLTHGRIVRNLQMIRHGIQLDKNSRVLSWFPYYHDFGLFGSHLLPALNGTGEFRLQTEEFGRSPENYLALLGKHRISHTFLTPTGAGLLLRSLNRAEKRGRSFDLTALRSVLLGAEMAPPQICDELRRRLAPYGLDPAAVDPSYGLAEACLGVSCNSPGGGVSRTWTVERRPLLEQKLVKAAAADAQTPGRETLSFVSAGRALPGMCWRIADDAGSPLPTMRLGNLQLQSSCLTEGYCTPSGVDRSLWKEGWMDTGDVGFLTSDYEFVPVGRKKDVIVINGRNIYPYDIEQMVLAQAGGRLRSAIAAGAVCPDTGREKALLFLIFTRRPGAGEASCAAGMRGIASELRSALAHECDLALDHIFHIRQRDVPLTTSGKIMRHELARRFAQGEYAEREIRLDASEEGKLASFAASAETRLPACPNKEDMSGYLAEVWSGVLERNLRADARTGKAGLATDTDFFALGGDSMRAAQLAAALESHCGRKLPANFAYRHPTFGGQIDSLADGGRIERPGTDLEVLVRDILADVADVDPDHLSVDKPLLEIFPRMDQILKFAQEIRQVFGDNEHSEAALAAGTIRAMATRLEALAPSENDSIPIMPFQETLYFHSQGSMRNEPTGLSCYIMVRLHMTGQLDIPLFERVMNDVLRRHPLLAATLDDSGLVPCLRPAGEPVRMTIDVEDISHLPDREIRVRIQDAESGLLDYRWDLRQAPMFCVRFLKTAEKTWELLFHTDHMVLDGYSAVVLFMELLRVYDATLEGEPLPCVYEDRPFAWYSWISSCREKSARYKRDMEWHIEDFTPPPPRCAMPMKRNPAMIETVTFRTYHADTRPEVLAELREVVAANPKVSVNSILLAGLFKVVNVWTAENDLVLNLPLLNREPFLPGSRDVVGSFIDLLPLRLRTSFSEPILTMAERLEIIMREKLSRPVSSIALSREIARRSGIQGSISSIIFSNSISLLRPEDLHHKTYDIAEMPYVFTGAPGTTIDVLFHSAGSEWRIVWNYMQDLFDESFITTLAAQYNSLLRDTIDAWKTGQATRPFTSQAALPPEHAELLRQVNDTDKTLRVQPLHRFMQGHARANPQAQALTFADQNMTYAEFDSLSSRMAWLYVDSGVGKRSFVALALPRGIDLLLAQFAAFKAGAAYVPVDPSYPADRISYMVDDSQASLLVTTTATLRNLDLSECPKISHVVLVDNHPMYDNDFQIHNKQNSPTYLCRGDIERSPELAGEDVDKDDPAYMIYTSGSTGKPKGVVISHANFCNFADYVLTIFARGNNERFALVTSPSFDMTLASNLGALMSGASLHILSEENTRNVETLLRFLEDKAISLLNITPSHFSMLCSVLPLMGRPPRLHPEMRVLLGGEVVNPADVTQWMSFYPGHQVVNEYGPTEASVAVSFFPIPTENGVCKLDVIPIGKPMQNTRFYILNEEMQPCMLGVPGRLFIGGVNVAQGYWRKEEKTAQAFVPDIFARAQGREKAMMYDTGDMARWLEDGNVQFLGRNDRQVNLRGYRIELGEIENFMLTVPGVASASITVQSDHGGEKHLCAFYTMAEMKKEVSAQTMRVTLEALLPEYMVPRFYKQLERMPLTPSGKLDIKQLPYIVTSERPATATEFVPPSSREEKAIAAVWADIFNLEAIGLDDDFWELGGNSIRATRLLVGLHEAGFRLGLRELFGNPTVRGLAACLERNTDYAAQKGQDNSCGAEASCGWIPLRQGKAGEPLLLCLPYAGGSPAMFAEFAAALPNETSVQAALYPGIEQGEPLQDVKELARRLHRGLPEGYFVLFGYCFGAYVAHALARLLEKDPKRRVVAVVLTGATAPGAQKMAYDRTVYSAHFTNPESQARLERIYEPLLRNLPEDGRRRYWDNYRCAVDALADYVFEASPMNVPCHVLTGEQEEYPFILEYAHTWNQEFHRCKQYKVPGGHMLLQTHLEDLLKTMTPLLASYIPIAPEARGSGPTKEARVKIERKRAATKNKRGFATRQPVGGSQK